MLILAQTLSLGHLLHDVEYTPVHVLDPDYTGEISQSQACFKHGMSYTPPSWRRVYIKRKRIHVDKQDDESKNNSHVM